MKIMWVLLLYFAAMLAEPVFWYLTSGANAGVALPESSAQLGPGLGSTWSTQTAAPEAEPLTFHHRKLLTGLANADLSQRSCARR